MSWTMDEDCTTETRMVHKNLHVFKLIQTSCVVFLEKELPSVCCIALERDVVQWLKDVANDNPKEWKSLLPNNCNQKEIIIHGFFSCQMDREKTRHFIRCDPGFLSKGPWHDYIMEKHATEEFPRADEKGILPLMATPSKVLLLHKNPWDLELRAVTHACLHNVHEGKK